MSDIEKRVSKGGGSKLPTPEGTKLKIIVRDHTPLVEVFKNMTGENLQRSTPYSL